MSSSIPKAGFWIRVLAYIIDSAVFSVVGLLFYFLFWRSIRFGYPQEVILGLMESIQWLIIYLLLHFLYEILMTVHVGGTLGKLAVGAYVRKEENPSENIGFGQAIGRYLYKYLISGPVFYLGYIFVGLDKHKQGWHDRIARTIVVAAKERVPVPPPPPPWPPTPPERGGKKVGVLTITKGTGKNRQFDVRGPKTMIGSDSQCDIVLDNDNHYVSRQHCEIYVQGKDIYVRHLSHTNPTKINQSNVSEQQLRDRDVLTICDFELRFTNLPNS